MPQTRVGSQHEEVRTGASTNFQFRRLPVRSPNRVVAAYCGALGDIKDQTPLYQEQGLLHCPAVHVTHRSLNSHREASVVRSPPHEANSIAPQEALACAGGPREGDPSSPCSPSSPGLVVGRKECTLCVTLYKFSDALNKGWGTHVGGATARGVWSEPESHLHINILELKAVFLALKSFELLCRDQTVLVATDNTSVVSYINKQGGMRSGSLCALLWRLRGATPGE